GWITFILKERCPAATCFGIDLSPEMIERARAQARQQGYQDMHFAVSDVLHLPFEANMFDLVMSSSSFRLWGDQLQGLQEAYRVLRPGGLLFISDIGGDIPQEQQKMVMDSTPPAGRTFVIPALETAFPSARFESILRQTGFPDWECRVGGMCGFQPTDREVMDWLGDGFPLRDLQKSLQGKEWAHEEWARELRRHWIYIYIRKPKNE
ncbi:MAG: class I SAM-dependent methyltransferase, partial [Ktedonobacteraceae bacterium]